MNKNHKRVIGISTLLAIGALVLNYMRLEQKVVLTLAEVHSADYPTSIANQRFADLVAKNSEGRIQIEIYGDGQLGEETEVISKMQKGNVAFGRISIGPLAEYVDQLHALMLPYLYEDSTHMWKVLDSSIGEEMLTALGQADLSGLAWYDAGARSFYLAKEIGNEQELQDKRIRVQKNSLMYAMCEALGAKPQSLSENETYMSILNGSLDGAENNIPAYENYRQYEVCPYYILDEHTRMPEILVASQNIMRKLSKKDQNIIREAAKAAGEYERILWTEREEAAIKRLKDKGVQFIVLDENVKVNLKKACKSLYEEFGSRYQETISQIEGMASLK